MSDNPESNVPERAPDSILKKYGEGYFHYIRSDIAQAQTNAKVREVLLQILSSVENDSHIDVLVGINKLLNEYPDLLTNEEEKG